MLRIGVDLKAREDFFVVTQEAALPDKCTYNLWATDDVEFKCPEGFKCTAPPHPHLPTSIHYGVCSRE